ncbi:YicC family protein [Clostridiales bacterium]|nr:YicC family protein [Clostridiales bacterium]
MRSMTGCGTGVVRRDEWEATVDIKTVNHRFLDIGMRLPRNLSFLEQPVRNCISTRIRRGHADVFITIRNISTSASRVVTDYDLAAHYIEIARELSRQTGAENDMTVSRILRMEGVTSVEEAELNQDLITEICTEASSIAIDHLIGMREIEGTHLRTDLRTHLDAAASLRDHILERAPLVVSEYREKLEARLKTLLSESPDPVRISQEVAIIADRCAIDEELARLESHIRQFMIYLDEKDEIGKKMDFLVQEMNREANTIGSKASDAAIAQFVVDLKSEIEKMREQIQNVE